MLWSARFLCNLARELLVRAALEALVRITAPVGVLVELAPYKSALITSSSSWLTRTLLVSLSLSLCINAGSLLHNSLCLFLPLCRPSLCRLPLCLSLCLLLGRESSLGFCFSLRLFSRLSLSSFKPRFHIHIIEQFRQLETSQRGPLQSYSYSSSRPTCTRGHIIGSYCIGLKRFLIFEGQLKS